MKNIIPILLICLSLSACGQKQKPVCIKINKTVNNTFVKHDYLLANKPNKAIRKFNVKKYVCANVIVYIKPKPLK